MNVKKPKIKAPKPICVRLRYIRGLRLKLKLSKYAEIPICVENRILLK
jgi:hypothetical protein